MPRSIHLGYTLGAGPTLALVLGLCRSVTLADMVDDSTARYVWATGGPDVDIETVWEPPADGSFIQLMGDHTVQIPLWDESGLMFNAADELVAKLGVSADLAADIAAWGEAWQMGSGRPEHHLEAVRLVRRLGQELDYRYTFVYHP
jgi:hypothetical protein